MDQRIRSQGSENCLSWNFFIITLFFGLIPSILALVTNVTNGVSFIRGNHYEIIQGNCSEHDFYFDDDDDDDDDEEIVSKRGCFQKDIVFGALTFIFMFLPGLNIYPLFVFNISTKLSSGFQVIVNVFVCIMCVLTFPFLFIIIKTCCLFNHGKKMKCLAFQFVFSKCLLDSSLQLCFQVFAMLSRSERNPSWIQILAVICSSIGVIKIKTENFLIGKTELNYMFGKSFKKKIKTLVKFLPLLILTTLFKCVSFSIVVAILGVHAVWLYAIVLFMYLAIECFIYMKSSEEFTIIKFLKDIILPSDNSSISVFEGIMTQMFTFTTNGFHLFHMTFFLIIYSITLLLLTLLANLGHTLQTSDMNPLLNNLVLLNILTGVTLTSGVLAYILYIQQVYRATRN